MRALFATLFLLATISTVSAQTPPVEAFGRLPAVSAAALSPDGNRVAMAVNQQGQSSLRVIDLTTRRTAFAANMEEGTSLRDVGWADDGRVFMLMSRTFRAGDILPSDVRFRGAPRNLIYFRYGVVDLTTREMEMLTTNPEEPWADQGAELIAPIEGDPNYARMIGRAPVSDTTRQTVFRIDLRNGRARPLDPPGGNRDTYSYLLDERGQTIARTDAERATNRWRVFVYENNTPRLLAEGVSLTGAPLRVSGRFADGRFAVVDVDNQNEYDVLYALDPRSGEREVLFRAENVDVAGAIIDPWTRVVVGYSWVGQQGEQRFLDPALEAARTAAVAAFSPDPLVFVTWSRDRSRILFYGEQGLDGGAYYVFTTATQRVERLAHLYPELATLNNGERQAITYAARDRTRIPAYLTLPVREGNAPLPLVVLVHGGPNARDTFDFDWWATFLASRGYAVLQPNYRGSGGYGASWEQAGWTQWGGLMQTDVEDGVAALIRNGIADPARVCIVGASYGGYAALAGATLTPDRYRCAASIAGVSDLPAMLDQVAAQTRDNSIASDYWRLSMGDRRESRDQLRAVSPAYLADRVRIPVLLIHGTYDTVVPIEQSHRMRRALEAAGKTTRFVELEGDDHWLSDAETRTQMLRELETFLAQHLGTR